MVERPRIWQRLVVSMLDNRLVAVVDRFRERFGLV